MSAVQSSSTAPTVAARRGSLLAGATAVVFATEAGVAAVWPVGLSDHATGAGRVSEALAGMAFLLVAATLAAFAVGAAEDRWPWFVTAVLGSAAMGVAQVDIAARGQEWPDGVTTVLVLGTWVGLLVAGVGGARAGAWRWPVAVALAGVVPALFLVPSPYNSAVLALVFVAVAAGGRAR